MRSFVKIKIPRNDEITLSFTDIQVGKSCLSRDVLCRKYGFERYLRKEILAKISEFKVSYSSSELEA